MAQTVRLSPTVHALTVRAGQSLVVEISVVDIGQVDEPPLHPSGGVTLQVFDPHGSAWLTLPMTHMTHVADQHTGLYQVEVPTRVDGPLGLYEMEATAIHGPKRYVSPRWGVVEVVA